MLSVTSPCLRLPSTTLVTFLNNEATAYQFDLALLKISWSYGNQSPRLCLIHPATLNLFVKQRCLIVPFHARKIAYIFNSHKETREQYGITSPQAHNTHQ